MNYSKVLLILAASGLLTAAPQAPGPQQPPAQKEEQKPPETTIDCIAYCLMDDVITPHLFQSTGATKKLACEAAESYARAKCAGEGGEYVTHLCEDCTDSVELTAVAHYDNGDNEDVAVKAHNQAQALTKIVEAAKERQGERKLTKIDNLSFNFP